LLALSRNRELSEQEENALVFLDRAQFQRASLLIPDVTSNVLRVLRNDETYASIDTFLEMVTILYPTRYFRRWARRLRGMTFGREDANILGLGTFGTTEEGNVLGARYIVTWDEHLITKFASDLSLIQRKLNEMTVNLVLPFADATLPMPRLPEEFI
jgi:hypothetical protein